MKRILIIAVLGISLLNCFAQDVNDKFLVGTSIRLTHDDIKNNSYLTPGSTGYDLSNNYQVSGEFGYFFNPNSLIGIEISGSKQVVKESSTQSNAMIGSMKTSGISLNPKYKYINRITDKIWFYTDCKVILQLLSHKNVISQLDYTTYEWEYSNMNGKELKYGMAIIPGFIFKINGSIGIKIDYSLFKVTHSTINEAENNEIDFDSINAWDYGLNMNLAGLNWGIVFTL